MIFVYPIWKKFQSNAQTKAKQHTKRKIISQIKSFRLKVCALRSKSVSLVCWIKCCGRADEERLYRNLT